MDAPVVVPGEVDEDEGVELAAVKDRDAGDLIKSESVKETANDHAIPTDTTRHTEKETGFGHRASSDSKPSIAIANVDLEKQETPRLSENPVVERTGEGSELSDPDIVDWDGLNDPLNPINWPAARRWGMVAVVSMITVLTPLGSSMFAPGVPLVMQEFHSTNEQLESFVVSVYVLGFACGPLGAAPVALGGGTIADVISTEQRGTAMGVWMMGPTVGPVIGPIAGGFLSEAAGWRWSFYVLAIASGVSTILAFILLKETSASAILSAKTRRLRRETGNPKLRSKLDNGLTPRDLFLRSIIRPTKMLFRSPIVFLISLYVGVVYAYFYLLFTTFTPVYRTQYNFTLGTAGLAYIGIGVGAILGQFANTYFGNRIVRKHIKKGDLKPEHRLPMMVPGAISIPIALFWYGWSAQAKTHWIVPIVGTGVFGFGMMLSFMPASTYLIDVYTIYAASAMAANTVLRSVFAAVLPLAGQDMYATLGLGWGNSLLAFIALALMPTPLLFM
ncbi:MAG: hypothetical protein M1820_009823, partial [Bogoriella megaspora]